MVKVLYGVSSVISIVTGTRMLVAMHTNWLPIKEQVKTFVTWFIFLALASLLLAAVVFLH